MYDKYSLYLYTYIIIYDEFCFLNLIHVHDKKFLQCLVYINDVTNTKLGRESRTLQRVSAAIPDEVCLTVSHGENKELNIIFSSHEDRKKWVDALVSPKNGETSIHIL